MLEAVGLSAWEIADYLGHAKIGTTQNHYMARGVVGTKASAALGARPIPKSVGQVWAARRRNPWPLT